MTKPNIVDAGDVLILGAGLAGLFTALKLAPKNVTILAGTSCAKENGSSGWAQGGIAAAMGADDSPTLHTEDTIAAGAGLVDVDVAQILASEAPDRVRDLIAYGVPFDRDASGNLVLGREAAHSCNRIVHVSGDRAGAVIMDTLWSAVHADERINVISGLRAISLAKRRGQIVGVYAVDDNAEEIAPVLLLANNIVLATGGIGTLFETTTNPPAAKGDGLAMAARAGAAVADTAFVQFHPTAIRIGRDPSPLATEALRGEGAVLINGQGERFMACVHDDAELAPRDIVARELNKQIGRGEPVFLDCTNAIGNTFPDRFPTVFKSCMSAGIDPRTDPIPVAPAAHYHMGGVVTDQFGKTSVDGLWACGEVACTGAHGANRLASNSLLEAMVFGARIADKLRDRPSAKRIVSGVGVRPCDPSLLGATTENTAQLVKRIRHIMTARVGLVRTNESLTSALEAFDDIASQPDLALDVINMITVARLVTADALARCESRGGHYRADFPMSDNNYRQRRQFTLDEQCPLAPSETQTTRKAS